MGFFNEIGSKITGGVSAATNKTKELAEVSRWNSKISANNAAVKTKYEEIGKIVKAELAQDITYAPLLAIFSEIDAMENETAELKRQIQIVKGVRTCAHCGAEIPAGSAFCAVCGTKVVVAEPEHAAPVVTAQLVAPQPVVSQPSVQETPAPAAQNGVVCPKCGNHEDAGVRFCSNCGNKLEVPAQKLICSKCGNAEEPGTHFCSECGNRLDSVERIEQKA